MDDALFQKALQAASGAPQAPAQPDQTQAAAPPEQGAAPQADQQSPADQQPAATDPNQEPAQPQPQDLNPLGRVNEAIESVGGGAANAVFQTKDFLFGSTPEDQKWGIRKDIEATNRQLAADSPVNGFIMGVSQFATGMIGAGKFIGAAKAVPVIGGAVEAAGSAIAGGGKVAEAAASSAKAATVGAVAFDPHDARLSNLIESFPALSNPITRWLSASPDDSATLGRLKSAMESIGLDAAIGTTLVAATKVYKALARGDHAAAQAAADETVKAVDEHQNPKPAEAASEPAAKPQETPPAAPDGAAGQRQVEVLDAPGGAPTGTRMTVDADQEGVAAGMVRVVDPAGAKTVVGEKLLQDVPSAPSAPPTPAPPPKVPMVPVTDDQVTNLLGGMRADAEAIDKAGSWDAALEDGHTFGRGDKVPWQKMDTKDDPSWGTNDFIARVADAIQPEVDKASGGEVMSDRRVQQMVQQRSNLFGEDPESLMGMIHQAGKQAGSMAANMEAGYLVAQRAFQDAFALASRINAGVLDEFGGDAAAAGDALKHQLSLAATAYGAARSITANAGRAMRRMRSDFRLNPEDVQALTELDPDRLAQLIANTRGDPQALAKIATPSLWGKVVDWANFLQTNNLLWGWKTHLVNLSTNGYMLAARPAERIIGSFAVQGGQSIRAEALKQYLYMGTVLGDSWQAAKEAFLLGDSKLAPHSTESYAAGQVGAPGVNALTFKPWGSVSGLIHNVFQVASPKTLLAMPTRVLGMADEMMKQVTYRSKVLARANVQGMQSGLDGQALRDYINDSLSKAFDANGIGTDVAAKKEAQIATFQQDLLPNTLGKVVSNATSQLPALRLVLPFVKTPTNVLRYGWKMSPGLNLLQTEYRQMITGQLGKEAQAQAMGQMGMGALAMGSLAFRAAQGGVTGGGPSDPKTRSALLATGWQPYSYVIQHDDGTKTYVPYGKFDPIAMPMGIIADLADAIHIANTTEDDGMMGRIESGTTALLVSLAKQMGNKSYLVNLSTAIDAMDDPDKRGQSFLGAEAANQVPFSSGLRAVNQDPYLRDARSVVDKILATIPGLSETLPARYDAWGDPVTARKGLSSTMSDSIVDREVERQGLENGTTFVAPSSNIGSVDLRGMSLKDGRNAYEVYQQLAGRPSPRSQPLKEAVAKIIQSDAYAKAPDGPDDVKGTKSWLISGIMVKYRDAAQKQIKADPNVRAAMLKERLKVAGAYAQQRSDPNGARTQAKGLQDVGKAFGLDLSGLTAPAAGNGN